MFVSYSFFTLLIVSLLGANSPAQKGGIQVGDYIIKLDSVEYDAFTLQDLVDSIKSSKVGDVRNFEILRNDETLKLSIALDTVQLTSVNGYAIERSGKKIGVMIVENFAANTYEQFVKVYEDLEKEDVKALVIDVWQNAGGYWSSANQILSLFLNKGDVIYQRTDGESTEEIVNDAEKKINLPVVLVIDNGTASSSEIFVSSLNENLNAPVIGINSYGKGTIQKMQPRGEDRFIKYTVQEWLTPKGNRINGIGITPDVVIPSDDKLSNDVQLDKALEVVSNKIGG